MAEHVYETINIGGSDMHRLDPKERKWDLEGYLTAYDSEQEVAGATTPAAWGKVAHGDKDYFDKRDSEGNTLYSPSGVSANRQGVLAMQQNGRLEYLVGNVSSAVGELAPEQLVPYVLQTSEVLGAVRGDETYQGLSQVITTTLGDLDKLRRDPTAYIEGLMEGMSDFEKTLNYEGFNKDNLRIIENNLLGVVQGAVGEYDPVKFVTQTVELLDAEYHARETAFKKVVDNKDSSEENKTAATEAFAKIRDMRARYVLGLGEMVYGVGKARKEQEKREAEDASKKK